MTKQQKGRDMHDANLNTIVTLLEKEQTVAEFTERKRREPNREKYGIYDIRNSAYGRVMLRFNEAYNSGKLIHYIDLRIPSLGISLLVFDYNLYKDTGEENTDYKLLYNYLQHTKIEYSSISYDAALSAFVSSMKQKPGFIFNNLQENTK